VAELLRGLEPTGLDASSGVERSPGDKDLEQVRRLLAALPGRVLPPPPRNQGDVG
jgi:phosphoribosylanthranilate isomerase